MSLTRIPMPCPNYSSRGGAAVRLVVLHTAEGALTIESLSAWFNNPSSGVSSHVGIDDKANTVGEYVLPQWKAWTQGEANPVAVSAELCAFASWSRAEWDRHPAMLMNAAQWVAEECARFNIPIRSLSAAEAQGGAAGVCDHVDLGAWGGSHWDCGDGFPMADVLAVAAGTGPSSPVPSPIEQEETIVLSAVVQHRLAQLSCAQACNGQLWHKFSQDGGLTWRSDPLIRPNGDPVKATVKDTVSISVIDGDLFISTEDVDGRGWMCRQPADITLGWDIRALP